VSLVAAFVLGACFALGCVIVLVIAESGPEKP